MALFSGKVTESLVEKGRRFAKFIGMGRDDVKKHRAIAPWGDESVPIRDAIAIYGPTSVNGESVVLGYINQIAVEGLNPGEKRLFSTNSNGVEQIYVKLTDAGEIEFGAAEDNLIRYLEMKAAFDTLVEEYNTLVDTFNTHQHPETGGTTGTTTVPAFGSSADMSAAKIDELKCSG